MISGEEVVGLARQIAGVWQMELRHKGLVARVRGDIGVHRYGPGLYTQGGRWFCSTIDDFASICVKNRWIVRREDYERSSSLGVAMTDEDFVVDWDKIRADQQRAAEIRLRNGVDSELRVAVELCPSGVPHRRNGRPSLRLRRSPRNSRFPDGG